MSLINYEVTIANGSAVSDAIEIGDLAIVAVIVPAAWTTASVAFQTSHDGTTFGGVYDNTDTLMSVAAARNNYGVNPNATLGFRWVKAWSHTAGVSENQLGDRVVTLVCRAFA